MSDVFKNLAEEVDCLCRPMDVGFNTGLTLMERDKLLNEHKLELPDTLANAYLFMNGNRRIQAEGQTCWDQSIVPLFKGAFHFLSLQESIYWMHKDVACWVPQGCFPIASRVERDYLSIDLITGRLHILGTYTMQQTISDSFDDFLLEYLLGLNEGIYVLDTEYQYYPRIVHPDDKGKETLSYTFTNTEIG